MAKAAYYNLLAAALTTPVAIASRLIAWQWQLEGRWEKSTAAFRGFLHLACFILLLREVLG